MSAAEPKSSQIILAWHFDSVFKTFLVFSFPSNVTVLYLAFMYTQDVLDSGIWPSALLQCANAKTECQENVLQCRWLCSMTQWICQLYGG